MCLNGLGGMNDCFVSFWWTSKETFDTVVVEKEIYGSDEKTDTGWNAQYAIDYIRKRMRHIG